MIDIVENNTNNNAVPQASVWGTGLSNINKFQKESKLLDITLIEPGEKFSGIVFCLETKSNANKYIDDTYNVSYKLIDKNGKVFNAMMFASKEKLNINNTPLLIKEGYCVSRFGDKIYYNISEADYFTESPLQLSVFMKTVTNLQDKINTVSSLLVKYASPTFITKLQNTNIMNIISNYPYSNMVGTQIGFGMEILETSLVVIDKKYSTRILENDASILEKINMVVEYLVLSIYKSVINSSMAKKIDVDTNNLILQTLMNLYYTDTMSTTFNRYSDMVTLMISTPETDELKMIQNAVRKLIDISISLEL